MTKQTDPIRTISWSRRIAVLVLFAAVIGVIHLSEPALAQENGAFPLLEPGRRVYDETTTSLTPDQVADLERRLSDLRAVGADAIVYVRATDATPEETLDQVEALQQAWVATTAGNQDNAVAILINRNPNDPNDARAGIFVGATFDDGNVPRGEQRNIVDDALIPPLRDGDVYASLTEGLTRLDRSIRNGPPQNAFERWAEGAAGSWLPGVAFGLAVLGFGTSLALFRRREVIGLAEPSPTTTRPGELSPALAAALVNGGPQASAVPATLLDLAARNALNIEGESEGGTFSKPKIQVRLLDRRPLRDPVDVAVWNELEQRVEDGTVSSKKLQQFAANNKPVRKALDEQMRASGWLNLAAPRAKGGLILIAIAAGLLSMFGLFVAGTSGQWLMLIGIVPLAVLAVAALVMYSTFSNLTRIGQEAATPWRGYRAGLKQAAKNESVPLNLDDTLADTVAMNLGAAMDKRLKRATESGQAFRAFMSGTGADASVAYFPWWIAFSSTIASSSGVSTSTVSGGGAGGGGGAAGST